MREVLLVNIEELEKINEIYKNARVFMKKSNNPNQWGDSHPSKELLIEFIEKKVLYKLVNEKGEILAVFAFIIGEDPTYVKIEGSWKSNTKYGTLHAVASSLKEKGVFKDVCNFAKSKINHIRIDTSHENLIMQKKILNEGYVYCGIIHIANGDPRLAYEYVS